MADHVLRIPTLDDVDAIADVHRAAWHDTYTGKLPQELIDRLAAPGLREEQWREWLAPGWRATGRRIVVGEVVGRIVGFACAQPTPEPEAPRPLELRLLYSLTETHGSGLGAALFDAVVGDAPAWLWVHETNARALAFYRRRGFALEEPPVTRYEGPPFDLRMVR